MSLKKIKNNVRSLFSVSAAFALAVTILWFGADASVTRASDEANAPEATFAANAASLGAIPDSDLATPTCANNSTTKLDVTFTASGLTGAVQNVSVSFNAAHTYPNDLEVTLIAPNGASHLLFAATGTTSTAANACAQLVSGSNDLSSSNTYTFNDAATANWWTTAASANPVPTSSNRTVVTGVGGAANPPPVTSMNAAFAGVTNANGTWTLRFRDRGAGDTGSVTAANLTLTTGSAAAAPGKLFDFTGTGRTSFVTLGFPTLGNIRWNIAGNPASAVPNQAFIRKVDFGLVGDDTFGDSIVANDFVGDQKTELAVFRDTNATFYLAQTPTGTGGAVLDRAVQFGLGTDVPGADGDYDGDGKADYTLVRVNGSQLNWYILTSATNTYKYANFGSLTGIPTTGGATVFPGADFTGDGIDELIYVRRSTATPNRVDYFIGDVNTSTLVAAYSFGNYASDYSIAPDDYTGDGKADLVAVRQDTTVTNQQIWYIYNPVTGAVTSTRFGIPGFTAAADIPIRGDYDGDNKMDIAVWRPSNQTFYWLNSSTGSPQAQFFGNVDDVPLAAFGEF